MLINEIAARIPAEAAQLAVARILAVLGSEYDWDSETIADVATAVGHAHPAGVPSAFSQDEDAIAFWKQALER